MSPSARNCLLLVEDDELVRMTVALMLEDDGFGVVEASSAHEALCLIRDGLEAAVLVTDVDLGCGPSGVQLADDLRALQPGIGIVFITGRPASIGIRVGKPNEAVLAKPFQSKDLSRLVRSVTAD